MLCKTRKQKLSISNKKENIHFPGKKKIKTYIYFRGLFMQVETKKVETKKVVLLAMVE